MAALSSLTLSIWSSSSPVHSKQEQTQPSSSSFPSPPKILLIKKHLIITTPSRSSTIRVEAAASGTSSSTPDLLARMMDLTIRAATTTTPPPTPTWQSSLLSNALIFALGSPLLLAGLSLPGIVAAFLLGTLTWRAFGPPAFLLVATYFLLGTAATKLKLAQKEAEGVAERRSGRRGPSSVLGSSAAGCVCAVLSVCGAGGPALSHVWRLGFVSSFCTKLSDTVSSEIGKAYGKTTYLVTTFQVVPRGTEGAVSVEGTIAGLSAATLLAALSYFLGEIDALAAVICVAASQIANLGESLIGASLQDKEGFQWLNNDAVNIINISVGSILAVLMQQIILKI